jgi:hypothetical protein
MCWFRHRPGTVVSLEDETRTSFRGRQQVVGDGMVGRFDDVKKGDLHGDQDGVQVPDSLLRTDRYEEPTMQESEHP